jgi:hypothetical protein
MDGPDAVGAVHLKLIAQARQVAEEMEVPAVLIARFGLLSLAIQVKGAIAVSYARKAGMRPCMGAMQRR